MDYIVNIKYANDYGYYIIIIDTEANNDYELDEDIAGLLGLSEEQYMDLLKKSGASPNSSNMFYFNQKSDIMNFRQWLEENIDGLLVAKALDGEQYETK